MKPRAEWWLGAVLAAGAIFVGIEVTRAPRRASVVVASSADSAAPPDDASGLARTTRSSLPPPPPHDYPDIARRLTAAKGVTYMDAILAERGGYVARWIDRRDTPITVWIQSRPGIPDFWPDFRDRARDAFYTWAAAGVPLRFLFVDDSTTAEVRLRWLHHFPDAVSGRTYWTRDQHWWIIGADIEIAVHRPTGAAYDGQAIRTITLHEVGHLIGLDHSPNTDDIMAPSVHVNGLSPADLRTAALVYALPPGPVAPPRAP